LHELVSEGLQNKLYRMPEDAQLKLQETLQKIINEGSGGLICIICNPGGFLSKEGEKILQSTAI